jgi:hypothetical protein
MAESYPPTPPTPPPPYALSNTPPYLLRLSPISSPPVPLTATELHYRLLHTQQQNLRINPDPVEQLFRDLLSSPQTERFIAVALYFAYQVDWSWEIALLMGMIATRGERGLLSTFVLALKGYYGFKKY